MNPTGFPSASPLFVYQTLEVVITVCMTKELKCVDEVDAAVFS